MMRTCSRCGFILGTRPGLGERDGVCSPCLNQEKKSSINFVERQVWLTQYLAEHRTHPKYDCVVAVSGGKDSHSIVKTLVERHGVQNPLLVTVRDEFTLSQAGMHNRDNLGNVFHCDHIVFRSSPKEFRDNTYKDFMESLHPLKWMEQRLYAIPIEIAKSFGINVVFFGDNPDFEYGKAETLEIFHPATDSATSVLYMGAIYPYSIGGALQDARSVGFKDLDDFNEWPRDGNIENFTQIDSFGYIVHLWCKFPKFGFQRVSDMACRYVREGLLTREQAMQLIKDKDYRLDVTAMRDFCHCLGISEQEFSLAVDAHANHDIVIKDCNNVYRRKDLL